MTEFVNELFKTITPREAQKFQSYMDVTEFLDAYIIEGEKYVAKHDDPECTINGKVDDLKTARDVIDGLVTAEMLAHAAQKPALMRVLADDDPALANTVSEVTKEALQW